MGARDVKKGAGAVWISPETDFDIFEADELFWFVEHKEKTETRENTYIMVIISRKPRQIVGFGVEKSKSAQDLQKVVDAAPPARYYCTDGNFSYTEVAFPGRHIRNAYDKGDTHNVESINADLRDYIAGLARRRRCFFRKLETLRAVLTLFANAYNRFGAYKQKYRSLAFHKPTTQSKHLHKWSELKLGLVNFV
jgi:IS1 family transposase